jgi:hypothetical protein
MCECIDKGCPAHRGTICTAKGATTILRRIDMHDVTGTAFCESCAIDAMESGLFTELEGKN